MKTRMDKYYKDEEVMQRTSKNDTLYDELYREKQIPRSNVTVLDNINEIDITKIKAMVDGRESYKKKRDFENAVNPMDNYRKREIDYEFEEIDYSNYDINEIIKKKRSDKVYKDDSNRVRRISAEYNTKVYFDDELEEKMSDEFISHETQLKELFNTVSRTVVNEQTDLFSNLKEDVKEESEDTFYTKTANFSSDDFDEDLIDNGTSKWFVIVGIIAVLVAALVVVYLKFLK